jgi:DNA repair exonuclease SbcCD ATPase subunit
LLADSERSLAERERAVQGLDAGIAARLEELEARERRVRKGEERQRATAERLERHSADLTEREQALARLGQSLLSRRDGDGTPVEEATESTFVEGLDALRASTRVNAP